MLKKIYAEYKAPINFLLRFFLTFGILSLLYAFWVKSFGTEADSFSWFIGRNLELLAGKQNMSLSQVEGQPAIQVWYKGKQSVSLFEGCNGVAVMILFFAFLLAFKGTLKHTIVYAVVGIFIIHLFNLGRLMLLVVLSQNNEKWFHFAHKYLFTLIIYAAVMLLWFVWVKYFSRLNFKSQAT